MRSLRRAYILITSALTLQAATWAGIFLLRSLVDPDRAFSIPDLSFQIAVLVILVPIHLLHWRWAERIARQPAERSADARRFYLHAMDLLFCLGILAHGQMLLRALLTPLAGASPVGGSSTASELVRASVGILVLLVVAVYNRRLLISDRQAVGEPGRAPAFRRLADLVLAAVGLTLAANAIIGLLRLLLVSLDAAAVSVAMGGRGLADLSAGAIVGTLFWGWSWRKAQAAFDSGRRDEERSTLRKLYLYGVVLVTVLTTVTQAALLLAGFFREQLGLERQGDLLAALSVMAVNGLIWTYHHRVLDRDASAAPEAPRQSGIRRLYDYLVAAVGLAAFGAGLAGLVSVLIRMVGPAEIGDAQRELLAFSAAGLLAGLPVWLLPWRRAQGEALAEGEAGEQARDALSRKAYLYFFLLVSSVALIVSGVYIVFRLVSTALGEPDPENDLGFDLAQALSIASIAAGGWAMHFRVLRGDGHLDEAALRRRLSAWPTLIVDAADGHLGHALLHAFGEELEGLPVAAVGLTRDARDRLGDSGEEDAGPAEAVSSRDALRAISEAKLLVLPWDTLEVGGDRPEIATAIAESEALKLLLPTRNADVEWAGVDRWSEDDLVDQVVSAVGQIAAGAEVEPSRPLGAGTTLLLGIGGFVLLLIIGVPLTSLLMRLF